MNIAQIMEKMMVFSEGSIRDINHFIRVWTYARTIGCLEGLDPDTQFILEAAAITHDIACPLCRRKYGSTEARFQEAEGEVMVKVFLKDAGLSFEQIDRIAFLVGHHHTLTAVDGPDFQILVEADYITNASEKNYEAARNREFMARHMKTSAGKRIAAAVLPLEDGKAGSLEGKAGSSGKEGGAFGSIEIRRISITDLDTDAVVNAANDGLRPGGGVCGAIFRAAGYEKLDEACKRIGHCATGSAVITPGFDMKAKYIIHAVGPVWKGGKNGEPGLLYGAYYRSLELAEENGCASIGFPLISAGIYSYPLKGAWTQAIKACSDYLEQHGGSRLKIIFAVLDDENIKVGREMLNELKAAKQGR